MEPDLHRNAMAWQLMAVTEERDRLKALNAELVEALDAVLAGPRIPDLAEATPPIWERLSVSYEVEKRIDAALAKARA